jgi:ferredoxin-like protein FixX
MAVQKLQTFSERENNRLYTLFIACMKRNKNIMKICPAIVYRLTNRFLILVKKRI